MDFTFSYPVIITPDEDDFFMATFPDIPEAITCGRGIEETLAMAEDCLETAISVKITDKEDIPTPSPLAKGQYLIPLSARMAFKTALYLAFKESGLTKVALAEKMGLSESQARRILDPRHRSDIDKLAEALAALGMTYEIEFSNLPAI